MKVSVSRIKLFKACRRAYELKYVENMYPIQDAEPLVTGKNFHEKVEDLYKTGSFEKDNDKETAMAMAFEKYVYPHIKVVEAEKWMEKRFSDYQDDDILIGKIDGIADDGMIVEYKTTSNTNLDEYEYDLAWDEQILAYMYLSGKNLVHYVIIRKPNIRQKKNESDEDFFTRMVEWYDEDTRDKIRIVDLMRTDYEIQDFKRDLEAVVDEIESAEVNDCYYKNTSYCWRWGRRCEYAQICLNYDPDGTYVDYERREPHGN